MNRLFESAERLEQDLYEQCEVLDLEMSELKQQVRTLQTRNALRDQQRLELEELREQLEAATKAKDYLQGELKSLRADFQSQMEASEIAKRNELASLAEMERAAANDLRQTAQTAFELEVKNQKASVQIAELTAAKIRLMGDCESLRKAVQTLESRLEAATVKEREIQADWQKKFAKLKTSSEALQEAYSQSQDSLERLQLQLAASELAQQSLANDLQTNSANYQALQRAMSESAEEKQAFQETILNLSQANDGLRAESRQYVEKIEAAQQSSQAASKKIQFLTAQIERLSNKANEAEILRLQIEEALKEQQQFSNHLASELKINSEIAQKRDEENLAQIAILQSEVTAAIEERLRTEEQLTKQEGLVDEQSLEIRRRDNRIADLQQSLKEAQQRLSHAEEQFAQKEEAHNAHVWELQCEFNLMVEDRDELRSRCESSQRAVSELESEYFQISGAFEAAQLKIDEKTSVEEQLKQQLEAMAHEMTLLKEQAKRVSHLESEVTELRAQNEGQSQGLLDLQRALEHQKIENEKIAGANKDEKKKWTEYLNFLQSEKVALERIVQKSAQETEKAIALLPLRDYLKVTEKEISRSEVRLMKTPASAVERPQLERSLDDLIQQRDDLKALIAETEKSLQQRSQNLARLARQVQVSQPPPPTSL